MVGAALALVERIERRAAEHNDMVPADYLAGMIDAALEQAQRFTVVR